MMGKEGKQNFLEGAREGTMETMVRAFTLLSIGGLIAIGIVAISASITYGIAAGITYGVATGAAIATCAGVSTIVSACKRKYNSTWHKVGVLAVGFGVALPSFVASYGAFACANELKQKNIIELRKDFKNSAPVSRASSLKLKGNLDMANGVVKTFAQQKMLA